MSEVAALDAALGDAELAVHLFVANPMLFGGIVLRGDGPARDAMLGYLKAAIEPHGPVARIPGSIDSERLLGGLDLSATLAAGHSVRRSGILEATAGGAVIVPMAERLPDSVAAHIALALDGGDLAAILLDDGCEPDEIPPAMLAERIAFRCDVSAIRDFEPDQTLLLAAAPLASVAPLSDAQWTSIADMSHAFGVDSARALIFADKTARAHAALSGRRETSDDDIAAAIRLVLAPRATRRPESAPPPPQPEPDSGEQESDSDDDNRNIDDADLDDILLEAAAAAIPQHILDQIDGKARGVRKGQAGRSGQKQKSAQRGRPLGARSGVPGQGKRLALIDTLRAAAPWQTIRRNAAPPDDSRHIHIRKTDLKVRHYEQRRESLTIFAVDASGSSALSRLAEAKGAVELMLAQAYTKRSQVALIAFRQSSAEILLPPTRSLTRARRALAALPGGGGTPLAAGLLAAQQLAEAASKRGQTPTIAMLTDGKGNVAIDGTANRTAASAETLQAASGLRLTGFNSIVIDISPRPRDEAAALAEAMGARYLPLPSPGNSASGAAMVKAIESVAAA